MVESRKVPPTRSNLLRLRQSLTEARQGRDLLERKREVLVHELLTLIEDAEATETTARQHFAAAYNALSDARMRMGADRLRWASLARAAEIQTQISLRGIMGVEVPLVQMTTTPLPLPYSLGDTSVTLDEARERWLEVAALLGHLAEATATVWRLATELRKTQHRVNALDHVLIPQYETSVQAIEAALEEHEREAFGQAKRVKALQEADSTM